MSNRPKHHRRLLQAAVSKLVDIYEQSGELTAADYQAGAKESTYSVRHVKRATARRLKKEPVHREFSLTEQMIIAIYLAAGRIAQAHRCLLRQGVQLPSVRHFRRQATKQMGETALAYARGGALLARNKRVHLPMDREHRGQTFEFDHTELPIWIVKDGTKHKLVRPWLTVAFDRATRYVVGWVVTLDRPSSEEVCACLAQALAGHIAPDGKTLVGGRPVSCVWDRGLEFLSEAVTDFCQRQFIMPLPLPAYTPTGKPFLERFWKFLKEDLLADLPAYIDGPHDVRGHPTTTSTAIGEQEFMRRITDWMNWYVSEHAVSTTGMTPLQAWVRDLTPVETVPPELLWNDYLRFGKRVKVSKTGVRFKTVDYIGPLDMYVGRSVDVRYLPHDPSFIEVFDGPNHICTAYERHDIEHHAEVLANRAAAMSQASAWGAKSNRQRRHGHDASHPLIRERGGRLSVKSEPDSEIAEELAGIDYQEPEDIASIGQLRFL